MQAADSESEQELYTIPSYSSWFSWDEIHENERIAHGEFFNSISISKTPKIYKDYRDFIINKYREEPSRRLTFTDVRKCLIGDVGSIHKIFNFLEKWGLINFSALPLPSDADRAGAVQCDVVVEDGSPDGVRVVEYPNSGKAMAAYSAEGGGEEGGRGSAGGGSEEGGRGSAGGGSGGSGVVGLRLPPLTSYSDVFGEAGRRKGCWNCGEDCIAGYYESIKQTGSVICEKCFKNENYMESKLADDFKFNDVDANGTHGTSTWTDEETLLLLEAIMKYGDDWNAVVQQMPTKNKIDCILRLIQLPFGEHMLGTINVKSEDENVISQTINTKLTPDSTIENQEPIKTEEQQHKEETAENEQIEDGDPKDAPPKRRCISSFADAGSSLLKQVALLSAVVGPRIAAATSEAAFMTLCKENPCIREIFEAEEDSITEDFGCATMNAEPVRVPKVEAGENQENTEESYKHSEMFEPASEKKAGPSMLHIRAAIATALAAAAAQSKLLADQEEREIEHLMANIIDAQLKKIQCKMNHFEELESIMEKEYTQIQQIEESIVVDWMNVLRRTFSMSIPRHRDHGFVKI